MKNKLIVKTVKEKIVENNKQLFFNYFEYYDEKYGFKKISLYRNKNLISLNVKKYKIRKSFSTWYQLPYALLLYAPNLKYIHHMFNYLYSLKEGIIIRKARRFYKSDYNAKNITGFNCYRIYISDFYKLYNLIEEITEYNVFILGLELHNKLYTLEKFSEYFKTIKVDLDYFFNITNEFNKDFDNIFNSYNQIDLDYNKNLNEIFNQCQHIIKLDEAKGL